MPTAGEQPDTVSRGLIIVVTLLFIVIIAAGILFYQSQEQQIKDRVTNDLTSIAKLKADEIARWREDRLYDARATSSGDFFIEGVDHYLTYGDDESREKILSRFREMNSSPHYDNILLVDQQGDVQLSLDPAITSITPQVKAQVNESLKSDTATLTDFHLSPGTHNIHLDVIAPILMKTDGIEQPIGAVLLSVDPDKFLYPFIQSWPVPSESAETLLVEREDDHVLFLNELRYRNNTALNLTIPLSQTDVPAVMAVHGTTGAFEGIDYRGVDVISVLEPVPDSPWFMITKVDTEEAFSAWRSLSTLIIGLVGGSVAGALVIIGLIWQRRQKYYYYSQYAAESERMREEQRNRERLETLVRLSEMETTTEQELVNFVLDAACRLTGSTQAFLGVMSPDETVFDFTAWSKPVMNYGSPVASPFHLPIENAGIWAKAVQTRKPFIVNDYPAPKPGKEGDSPGHVPTTRLASVPIFEGGRIVMVCAIADKETEYSSADIDNLTLLMKGVWNHLRKRSTENALRKSEEKFRTMADWTYDWEYWTDRNRDFVYCSPSVERITGYSVDKFIADKWLIDRIVHPDDRVLWENHLSHHTDDRQGNNTLEIEFRIIAKDGAIHWIGHSCRSIYAGDGTFAGRRISNRDITGRKKVEEQVIISELRYRRLFESAKDGILILNRDTGEIIEVNMFMELLLGYSKDELLGKHLWDIGSFKDQRASKIAFTELQEKEYLRYEDLPLETRDGRRIEVEFVSNVYPIDHTSVIQCNIRDITDRKTAEETLRQSEHRFRSAFELAAIGMSLTALDGRFMKVNRAFTNMTGYSEEEILQSNYTDITYPEDTAASEAERRELLSGIKEVAHFEKRYVKKDGQIIWAFVSHILLRDENNKPQYFVTHIQDVTERKLTEHQREALIEELGQKNAELERFTYTVSHDLKSPLITIRGFLGLLREDAMKGDTEQMDRDISRISLATDKMQALLSDLLTLSRIGRITNPPEQVNFGTIAEEARELLAGTIQEHGVTVTIAPGLPDVFVDHTRVREVLTNLIENAIKFRGDQEPGVDIGVLYKERHPVFYVRDNGIGIEPQYLTRIFGLFEKLDPKSEGTGIGLAIVKRIIEMHGGRIWVESAGPGQGVTFWFTLKPAGDTV